MSITFETLSPEAIQAQHNRHWADALAALSTPVVGDADTVHPATTVMPYFAAYRAYAKHIDTCPVCGDDPYADCPEGDELGHRAAEAMADQEILGMLN